MWIIEFDARAFGAKGAANNRISRRGSADATLLIAPTKQVPTHFHFVKSTADDLVEEAQDLATGALATRLVVVHDA